MVVGHRFAPISERKFRIDLLRFDECPLSLRIRKVVQKEHTAQKRRLRFGLAGVRKDDRAEVFLRLRRGAQQEREQEFAHGAIIVTPCASASVPAATATKNGRGVSIPKTSRRQRCCSSMLGASTPSKSTTRSTVCRTRRCSRNGRSRFPIASRSCSRLRSA